MSVDLLVVFFLLLYAVSMVLAQLLILSPPVLTTYLGGDAHFICTKDLSMEIAWYSSFFPIIFQNNHANFSELHFTVSDISLNNTLLYCIGRNPFTPSKIYSSNSGLIVIQGLLPELAVNLFLLDACTTQISWDRPFTQPGVPILGYNVNITNVDTNSTRSIFINDTTLNIPLGYDYMVSIAGVNIIGEGNETIVFVDSIKLANKSLNVTHIDAYRKGSAWKVDAVVESEHFCQNSTVSYKICKKTNNAVCSSTNNITQNQLSNNETILSAVVFVSENQLYDITVINEIGKYFLSSSGLDMSTYDIQSVDERNSTNGSICFEINYVKGGIATGCHVLINCESDNPLTFNITGYNKQYHKYWCSPIPFYGIKTCSIQAYDKVYEVVESKSGPAVQFNITVTGRVLITTQTSVPSPGSDTKITPKVFFVVAACMITTIITFFIVFTIWYLKKNKDSLPETVTPNNTIVPQHSTIKNIPITTKMPDEFIARDKEDNKSVASMSAIKITQKEETKM